MRKRKIILPFICILLVTVNLCGCGKKQIFESEEDKYELVPVVDTNMENEIYYIKDGSRFFASYMPEGTIKNVSETQSPDRLLWCDKDLTLIPSLYKNEIIAYSSLKNTTLDSIVVERFMDVGYSMGIYNGTFNEQGEYCISVKNNVVKDSSAYKELHSEGSSDLRIITIDDNPITPDMVSDGGIFLNLEQNKTYEIGYYAGTHYATAIITADYYFFQSYETYFIDEVHTTKNGYLSIEMPEICKSGYYMINGSGIYKYYDFEKGAMQEDGIDMNEAYYASEDDKITEYSQQYTVSVTTNQKNVAFQLLYDAGTYSDDKIKCTMVSPDDTRYQMDAKDGEALLELSDVMPGKWKIYVYPADIKVLNIYVDTANNAADAVQEVYEFEFEESDVNIQFYASYEGNGEIWGTVEDENGTAQTLNPMKKESTIVTTFDYLPAGKYKMTVYHYVDTSITDTGWRTDASKLDDDIIRVEE